MVSWESRLAKARVPQHRYNAARAAALAECGKGKDDPVPDEVEKAKLRGQAREWLKAELGAEAKLLESGSPQARAKVDRALERWRKDADLAGIRDQTELVKLPEDERKGWHALWADVDTLLKKANGK